MPPKPFPPRLMKMVVGAAVLLLLLLSPTRGFAQFFGAGGVSTIYTSNVSGLDTSLPDLIINPSLVLGYEFDAGPRYGISAAAGASLFRYTSDPDRSYSALFVGVTPTYYFLTTNTFFASASSTDTSGAIGQEKVMSVAERIQMLDNWLQVVIPKLPRMRSPLDSAQELLSVVRELLATTAYTTSVKEIVLTELRHQLSSLVRLNSIELQNIVREWRALIDRLEETPEESDFLPVDELDLSDEAPEPVKEPERPLAPLTTLSTSHINFRNLSASDFYLRGDRSEVNERAIATSLSLPVSFSSQSNSDTFKSYSNNQLWLSLRFNTLPSEKFQFSAAIDNIRAFHPNDSLYGNVTWRARAAAKYVLGERDITGAEITYGQRSYNDPWTTTIDTPNFSSPRPRFDRVRFTAESDFSHFTFGLWHQHLFSDELTVGGVVSFVVHPDLRGYLVSRDTLERANYVSSAEDEFNFDHAQITGFLNTRLFEKYDVGVDLSYEHRTYGAIAISGLPASSLFPEVNSLIQSANSAARTENWFTAAATVSRLFLFNDPFLKAFSGVSLEAFMTYNTVSASVEDYSYDSYSISLSATTYF